MKRILLLMMLFAFAAITTTNAQVSKTTYSVNTIIVKDSLNLGGKWVAGISTDSTLSAKSDSLVTQKAIKAYVDSKTKGVGKDTSTISANSTLTITAGDLLELLTFYTTTAQTIKVGTSAGGNELVDNYKIMASTPTALRLDYYGGITDRTIYITGISTSTKLTVFKR